MTKETKQNIFQAIIDNNIDAVMELVEENPSIVNLHDDNLYEDQEGSRKKRSEIKNPLETAIFLKRNKIASFLIGKGAVIRERFKKRLHEDLIPASRNYKEVGIETFLEL